MSESSAASEAAGTANGSAALSYEGLRTAGQLVAAHLGSAGPGLELVQTAYPDWRWADVDAALDGVFGLGDDQTLRGIVPDDGRGLNELLADRSGAGEVGAVHRTAVPVSPDEHRWVATNALRLARVDGTPVVVFARGGPVVRIEVLAADAVAARAVLADIDAAVTTDSIHRGRVLTLRSVPSASGSSITVDIDERPGPVAEDVALPAGGLERLEAVVLGPSRSASRLRRLGQSLPRGVLLHGPHGAGSEHAVRYLVSQSPDTTAVFLQGASLSRLPPADCAELFRQVMTTAQQLAPAIVVLEDADLVAADRRGPGDDAATGAARAGGPAEPSALAELLDLLVEMDEDADVAVVLTTGRVEALEEALARRPDLLDLTLEVPLPDVAARARLFARAARDLPVTSAGMRTAAEVAVATPYTFPAQAVRRAVLDAVSAGGEIDDARLVATVRALTAERAELRTAIGVGSASPQSGRVDAENGGRAVATRGGGSPASAADAVAGPGLEAASPHDSSPSAEGSVAEVRGAGDVLAAIRAREARRDSFGAEGAFGGAGPHEDGLGGERGRDGDDDLGGGGGADDGLDDGLSGEDLLDLDLDDED